MTTPFFSSRGSRLGSCQAGTLVSKVVEVCSGSLGGA